MERQPAPTGRSAWRSGRSRRVPHPRIARPTAANPRSSTASSIAHTRAYSLAHRVSQAWLPTPKRSASTRTPHGRQPSQGGRLGGAGRTIPLQRGGTE